MPPKAGPAPRTRRKQRDTVWAGAVALPVTGRCRPDLFCCQDPGLRQCSTRASLLVLHSRHPGSCQQVQGWAARLGFQPRIVPVHAGGNPRPKTRKVVPHRAWASRARPASGSPAPSSPTWRRAGLMFIQTLAPGRCS